MFQMPHVERLTPAEQDGCVVLIVRVMICLLPAAEQHPVHHFLPVPARVIAVRIQAMQ